MKRPLAFILACVALLASWVLAASASAAFPGANGLLAVQPVTGTGVELISPAGTGAHRVCPADSACTTVRDPSWSPTGRDLVFSTPRGLRAIYVDGSCLDCQFGAATNPAFLPTGTELSFIAAGDVDVDGIDAIRKRRYPIPVGVEKAVWSAAGQLAVQSDGDILVGRPAHLREIGTGNSPSWAPDGQEIAAVQSGWIVLMPVNGGKTRRLARGTAPAFSPDGRFIAYVGAGHRLMIAHSDPGHADPRPVGHVLAKAVDWQPKPQPASGLCEEPPGSVVIGKSSAAVITSDEDRLGSSAEMGCLRSTGREHLLNLDAPGNVDGAEFEGFGALAAPYVALIAESTDAHYGQSASTVVVYDLRTGMPVPHQGGEGVRCGGGGDNQGGPCPALREVTVDSLGGTAASLFTSLAPGELTNPLVDLSCSPDGGLCATIDDAADLAFASADPFGGAASWTAAPLTAPAGLTAQTPTRVACPSSTLCVAIGGSTVWTDSDNSGWQPGVLAGVSGPSYLSCPSLSLCVSAGTDGQVAYTTDPAGGASTWQAGVIPGAEKFGAVSFACNPAGTCSEFAVNPNVESSSPGRSQTFTSTDPAGGAGTWTASSTAPELGAESCPSDNFCAALGYGASADVNITATPGGAVQSSTPLQTSDLTGISCPTASFCAAVGQDGALATSTSPQTGSWTVATIDVPADGVDGEDLNAIDCTSASSCIATDSEGHIITSTNPTGGTTAWTPTLIDGGGCNATQDCSDETILADDGHGVRTFSAISPGKGPNVEHLTITGSTVYWTDNGTRESASLGP